VIRLQSGEIRVDEVLAAVGAERDGAVALFLGIVRDHSRGRRVLHLEYEAYPEMAESEMAALAAAAERRFEISAVALVHRTGRLEIGEVSVAAAVAAPHRSAAFDACRFVIDTLKRTVPIWKKEVFEGGEVWIEGAGETQA
jgi:molybdopterin synthase catalytic subunit